MDSRRLSAEQVARLRVPIQRQAAYLHKLVERMLDLGWRSDDPLWLAACKATMAHDELLRQLVATRKPGGRIP